MMQTNAFYQMPAAASLYTSAYDLVAGSWPSGANQVVLVLDEDGNIPNLFEYTLGLKDHKEFDDLMRTYYQGTLGGKTSADAQTNAQSATSGRDLRLLHDPEHHLPSYQRLRQVHMGRDLQGMDRPLLRRRLHEEARGRRSGADHLRNR